MKCLGVSLVCLALTVVQAEDKSWEVGKNKEEDKSSEKRWIQPEGASSGELLAPNVRSEKETSKGQERAKEEKSFKDFVAYEAIQSILVNALKPKPIVDTAEESEKLAPNDGGSKVQVLGDLVVRGSESLSRALNTVIEVPKNAITKLSAGATQALNQLGAYLIGL